MKHIALAGALLLAVGLIYPHDAGAQIPAVPVADGVPLCGTEGTRDQAHQGVLKVANFNILHSDTEEGDQTLGARLELAADAVAASGADVVGLQEVTFNTDDPDPDGNEYPQKHGNVAQRLAAEVSERTGRGAWHWCWFLSNPHVPGTPDVKPGGGNPLDDLAAEFGNFPNEGSFREGVAVVSRYPIEDARSHRLTPRSYEAPLCVPPDPLGCTLPAVFDSRQVLFARVGAPGGAVDLFTTHIAHELGGASDATKRLQVEQVLAWIELWSDPATPDFLTGDFNSTPETDRIATVLDNGFDDTWAEANPGDPGYTGDPPAGEEVFTAANERGMQRRIDYVFARGCDSRASELIGTNAEQQGDGRWLWPSDHLGLVSTLACT